MRSAVGIPVLPAQAVAKAKGGEDVNTRRKPSRHWRVAYADKPASIWPRKAIAATLWSPRCNRKPCAARGGAQFSHMQGFCAGHQESDRAEPLNRSPSRQLSTCKAGCVVPGKLISIASCATLAGRVRQGKARTAYASLLLPALVGDSDLAFGAHA